MHDIFSRVGGNNNASVYNVSTQYMTMVNSGNVIIDNTWLWRADHAVSGLVVNEENPVEAGLIVYGDNVIGYGVAVEHTLGNMLQWYGNHGQTWFYQSEFPYDVKAETWGHFNYTSYMVGANVTDHSANGVGAYSFFRDSAVTANMGFSVPDTPGVSVTNALSLWLWGNFDSKIASVVNDIGEAASHNHTSTFVCWYSNK